MSDSYDAVEGDRWTGWIAFAGIMMIIGGFLQGFYGLVAILNDEWVVWANSSASFFDLTQWGWIHLIWGLVMILAGIGVMGGNILARTLGVVLAGIAALVNFAFIPVYPLWSVTVVVISIVVIYALVAHGRDVRRV